MKDLIQSFKKAIEEGYSFKGESIMLGVPLYDGKVVENLTVSIPLKTFNRHGLIAGATGTGKTKTLQAIAEGLSEAGVPVLLMDIKGDLSGLAAKGSINDRVTERAQKTGITFIPKSFPTELLSISEEKGVRLRSTVIEFGPVLFSKVLGLNDTQSGLVSLIFKFCDDNRLPLLDLKDFKKVLQYISDEGKAKIEKEYGNISTTSSATILRKVIDLEQQGANLFFGEKSFDVEDLIRND
ncbi:MAG TPA: helicase HerA-like domain-containing protein, partial [Cytophagaceae bacterium]